MSLDNQESLRKLEQARGNWQEKLADFEEELSITDSASKKFELRIRIEKCINKINDITEEINNLRFTANIKSIDSTVNTVRYQILESVKSEVESLFDDRLYEEKIINLRKESQPKHVKRPRDNNPYKPNEDLRSHIRIINFFDRKKISGKLLILGEAGSGKTVTLLELAKELITRAENDPREPIPVWLSLSSWKNQKIEEWLVSEYLSAYGKVSEGDFWNLLENNQLLPLLDNLDELNKNKFKCTEAINNFLSSQYRSKSLVVCSRLEEYKRCYPKLQLNGAVYLHHLSKTQIQEYFYSIKHLDIWENIQLDDKMLELVETPLFLDILTKVYQKISIEKLQDIESKSSQYSYLFNAYIEYAFEDSSSANRKKNWLSWLAKRLEENKEADFMLEKMQFDWLQTSKQNILYKIIVALVVTLFSLPILKTIYNLLLDCKLIPIPNNQETYGEIFYIFLVNRELVIPIIFTLFLGYLMGFIFTEINPVETLKFPGQEIFQAVRYSYLLEKILGVVFMNNMGTALNDTKNIIGGAIKNWIETLIMILIGLLFPITAPIRGLIRGLQGPDINKKSRDYPNQGIYQSAFNAVIYAVIIAIVMILLASFYLLILFVTNKLYNIEININTSVNNLVTVLTIFGLIGFLVGALYPGLAVIQHITLRLILSYNNYTPLNYVKFLEEATEKKLLERIGGRYRFMHGLLQEHFAKNKWL